MTELEFQERAVAYCIKHQIKPQFEKKLGSGQEGYVWEVSGGSAIKVFEREKNFEMEKRCYETLKEHDVQEVNGFNVPQLIAFDEELLVVQMTIVKEPFLLDFGKSRLYSPVEFSPEVLEDYDQQLFEHFGDMLPEVRFAISLLEDYQIYYSDARATNINCKGWVRINRP